MSIFCKIGIHRWNTEFEETTWEEYDAHSSKLKGTFYHDQYGRIEHSKIIPKMFYLHKGEIKHLPEGYFAFQRHHNKDNKIFNRVRICKVCDKKKHRVSSLYDTGYVDSWETTELTKNNIRDLKLSKILK